MRCLLPAFLFPGAGVLVAKEGILKLREARETFTYDKRVGMDSSYVEGDKETSDFPVGSQ